MTKTKITHCKNGHLYTNETTYWKKNGTRDCRICRTALGRERSLQKRLNKPIAIRKKKKPDEGDLNWAAGIFEGEGTFTMSRIKSKKCSHLTTAKIIVGNTDYQIVEFFKKHWGGNLRKRKKIFGKKQSYEWSMSGNQCWIFATDLLPYLRTDRVINKANLLIESEEYRKRSPRFGEESINSQQKLWEYLLLFRKLNKRGETS